MSRPELDDVPAHPDELPVEDGQFAIDAPRRGRAAPVLFGAIAAVATGIALLPSPVPVTALAAALAVGAVILTSLTVQT